MSNFVARIAFIKINILINLSDSVISNVANILSCSESLSACLIQINAFAVICNLSVNDGVLSSASAALLLIPSLQISASRCRVACIMWL